MGTVLEPNMTVKEAIIKLSEGVPGAIVVLLRVVEESPALDPDDAFSGWGPLISLNNAGIYGSRIWLLWKDVCGERMINFLAMLRAHQLGMISKGDFNLIVDGTNKCIW